MVAKFNVSNYLKFTDENFIMFEDEDFNYNPVTLLLGNNSRGKTMFYNAFRDLYKLISNKSDPKFSIYNMDLTRSENDACTTIYDVAFRHKGIIFEYLLFINSRSGIIVTESLTYRKDGVIEEVFSRDTKGYEYSIKPEVENDWNLRSLFASGLGVDDTRPLLNVVLELGRKRELVSNLHHCFNIHFASIEKYSDLTSYYLNDVIDKSYAFELIKMVEPKFERIFFDNDDNELKYVIDRVPYSIDNLSTGFQRIIQIAPSIDKALYHGQMVCIDNFDTFLNDHVLNKIVRDFHNSTNGAQLFGTCKNTRFLDDENLVLSKVEECIKKGRICSIVEEEIHYA